MASVGARRKANGDLSWRVQFRIGGKLTSETFPTSEAADEFARLVDRVGGEAARKIRDARTDRNVMATPTLTEWLEHHLTHATNTTAGTRAEYRRLAQRTWLPHLGLLPVDAITRDAVKKWVGDQAATLTRRGKPTSAKTIANAHGLLSTVMASAVEAGHRPDNPCRGVQLPDGTREEMVFLTDAEFARLLSFIPAYWHPLVLTLAGTGMRWGEATALHWSHVDIDSHKPTVRVAQAWKRAETGSREMGAPKTRRSLRTIPLPPQVVTALRPLRGAPDQLVFRGVRGGQVHHQAFHPRVWLPAVSKFAGDVAVTGPDGKPVTKGGKPVVVRGPGKRPRPHDLRHSHASWLIAAGIPLPVIQRRLGHESIKTTVDVYGHLAEDSMGAAAAAAGLALSAAFPEVEDPTPELEG